MTTPAATQTATETVRFAAISDGYAVEVTLGRTIRSIGRVCKFGPLWAGHAVGAKAWTSYLPTRELAVRDMRLGVTCFSAPAQ